MYFNYVRSLRFEDKPDYAYLRRLFRDLFAKEGKYTARVRAHTHTHTYTHTHTHTHACAGNLGCSACKGACAFFCITCTADTKLVLGSQTHECQLYSAMCTYYCAAGYSWDFVFDWTILKFQRAANGGSERFDGALMRQLASDRNMAEAMSALMR